MSNGDHQDETETDEPGGRQPGGSGREPGGGGRKPMGRPPKAHGQLAERVVAVRMTPADGSLLDGLVERQRTALEASGIVATVTASDVIRSLIRREATAHGIAAASPQSPTAASVQRAERPAPQTPAPPSMGAELVAPAQPPAATAPSAPPAQATAPAAPVVQTPEPPSAQASEGSSISRPKQAPAEQPVEGPSASARKAPKPSSTEPDLDTDTDDGLRAAAQALLDAGLKMKELGHAIGYAPPCSALGEWIRGVPGRGLPDDRKAKLAKVVRRKWAKASTPAGSHSEQVEQSAPAGKPTETDEGQETGDGLDTASDPELLRRAAALVKRHGRGGQAAFAEASGWTPRGVNDWFAGRRPAIPTTHRDGVVAVLRRCSKRIEA